MAYFTIWTQWCYFSPNMVFYLFYGLHNFWGFWQFLRVLTIFDNFDNFDNFYNVDDFWQFWPFSTILTIFDNPNNCWKFWQFWPFLQLFTIFTMLPFFKILTIDDNSDNCFCHFDNWKENPGDLWHLRHWLQFWQLRTWIHDNLCYLTINCDTGQHSQFLRCLILWLCVDNTDCLEIVISYILAASHYSEREFIFIEYTKKVIQMGYPESG